MHRVSLADFEVLIERAGESAVYRARVLNSPAGQASHTFHAPFQDLELENLILRLGRRPRVERRRTPELTAAAQLGQRLFDTVFVGEVRESLRVSLSAAESSGSGLRLRLRIDAPELVGIPWEYLYDSRGDKFFALSPTTPVVRFLSLPERIRPLEIFGALNMLVAIATPQGLPELDVEDEWTKLRKSVADLVKANRLNIVRTENGSLRALRHSLRRTSYHVLHFIGHGGFRTDTGGGILHFEDEFRGSREVTGWDLGVVLQGHTSLRLVVLNACEGGRSSVEDPFEGAAQALLKQGVPAVVGMQFEISDRAAITFSHELYSAVAAGYPIDAAVSDARVALHSEGYGVEWGTPVLYLRSPDGHIFVRPDSPPELPATNSPQTQTVSEGSFSWSGALLAAATISVGWAVAAILGISLEAAADDLLPGIEDTRLGALIMGSIIALVNAFAIHRITSRITRPACLTIMIGWAFGWFFATFADSPYLGYDWFIENYYFSPEPAFLIPGALGGFATSIVLRKARVISSGLQGLVVAVGWSVASGMLPAAVYAVKGFDSSVDASLGHLIAALALVGAIGGCVMIAAVFRSRSSMPRSAPTGAFPLLLPKPQSRAAWVATILYYASASFVALGLLVFAMGTDEERLDLAFGVTAYVGLAMITRAWALALARKS